jgi:hypothetical protein
MFVAFFQVDAQGTALSVTVTPPLIQLAIGPGETWSSSLKIVNNNPYDVTYYAEVVNFEAKGEDGTGDFIPLIDEGIDARHNSFSLASWITISADPITVPRGSSAEVPFTVSVPISAEPGGHSAAILVGTRPTPRTDGGPSLRISSYVSSLLFVKIRGETVERGAIREFVTDKTLYEEPRADFSLRFENRGNVHVQPQGDVTIYNMWGKKRGHVAINQKTSFGNVLPNSIRKFHFSWEAKDSYFDIGMYSAVATLAYGEGGKQNISATTYFWVVPLVPVGIVVISLLLFMYVIIWMVKRYIRRALELERMHRGVPNIPSREFPTHTQPTTYTVSTLMEPIRQGVIDLRAVTNRGAVGTSSTETSLTFGEEAPSSIGAFLLRYKLFFFFIAVLIVLILAVNFVLDGALEADRDFEISEVQTE